MESKTKQCQNCQQSFIIAPEDFAFYQKINVPEPTFCPECRMVRRMAFRNERNLYKRKCDLCGKEMISRYSPEPPSGWQKPFRVYCPKCWYSDNWDSLEYGQEYNFSRGFFEQFKEIIQEVPHISLSQSNSVNSDWINYEGYDKNCYLNVGGSYNEDSAYNTYLGWGKDSFDNYFVLKSEFCYETIFSRNCYKVFFSQNCFDCQNVILSYDCRNCSDLIGCAGLRHKKYYIFNQPYSKEKYAKFLKENSISSYQKLQWLKKKAEETILKFPRKYATIIKSVNSTGSYIEQSKNCLDSWHITDAENIKYCFVAGINLKECYDLTSVGENAELIYEAMSGVGGGQNIKFSIGIFFGSRNIEYGFELEDCHDCFGCKSLRKKSYCILNKQYSKEEYQKLRDKIVAQMKESGEYGEFFPISISPLGYNESVSQDYFPLSKKEALKTKANWNDYEPERNYQFSDYQIPDDIKDVKGDILEKILKCEKSGKAYRIIPMELEFYRKMGLPIPKHAPLQRHRDRLARMEPMKLYHRQCMNQGCANEFETTYASERPEIVYCEKCYQKEVE